ncbi:MAG: hypothetical protein ACKV22_39145 [Bryobacteraceae bacterium]
MNRPWVLSRSFFFLFALSSLTAAPRLRLANATVGPISIATGQSGAAQTVEAFNIGDGSLSLGVASSASWLTATTGAARACTGRTGTCIPISMTLGTTSLGAGLATAIVTVSDPNAVDAPQTITVTVAMGGSVPNRVDLFAPPNGSPVDFRFSANSQIRGTSNQPWLALAADGGGSFDFVLGFRVRATPLTTLADGAYNGTLTISQSRFAADNKAIAVSLRVTSQPIARVTNIALRVAQNSGKTTKYAIVTNGGLGTLTVTGGADPTTVSGGTWLSTGAAIANFVPATVDVTGMNPGRYRGRLNAVTNAVNGTQPVEIDLEVLAPGPPEIEYARVLDNATFERGGALSQGHIAAIFGAQLRTGDPVLAQTLPLGPELGGVRVFVNDRPAPVYYAQADQVNFQIPFDAAPGSALVRVEREGQRGNSVSVDLAPRVPRILRLGIGDYGIIVNQDGSFPLPPTPGVNARPATVGEALTIYAIGLGPTSPPVASGAGAPAAEPLARVEPLPSVTFGGGLSGTPIVATPLFVGLTPNFVGLYQINVIVPEGAPAGSLIALSLDMGNGVVSNPVYLAIQ